MITAELSARDFSLSAKSEWQKRRVSYKVTALTLEQAVERLAKDLDLSDIRQTAKTEEQEDDT